MTPRAGRGSSGGTSTRSAASRSPAGAAPAAVRGRSRPHGPAARRLDDPAADPRHERRRHRVARPARPQAGARPDRRHVRRGARHEPERGRPREDAHAAAARPRADPRRRLDRLVGRRLAHRRRQPGLPGLLRPRLRPRRRRASTTARTWATTSPTRAPSARRWRRVINGCPAFAIARSTTSTPTSTLAALAAATVARNILEHGLVAGRAAQRQRARPCRSRSARASRSPGWAGASTRTSSSSGSIRAACPTTGSAARRRRASPSPGTDFHAVVNGRIAVTPIHLDLTGRRLLRRLKTWDWTLELDCRRPRRRRSRRRPGEHRSRQPGEALTEEAASGRRGGRLPRSARISRAAFAAGAPVMPPPGWAPEPAR